MKFGRIRACSFLYFFHCFAYALVLTRPTPCYRITRKRFAIELSWFGSASICFGLGHFLFVLCGVPSLAFSSVPFLVLWSSLQKGRSAATSWAFPHLLFVSHLAIWDIVLVVCMYLFFEPIILVHGSYICKNVVLQLFRASV